MKPDNNILALDWYACKDITSSSTGWNIPFIIVGGVKFSNGIYYAADIEGSSALFPYAMKEKYELMFHCIPEPEPGNYYKIDQEDKVKLLQILRGYLAL